MSREDTVKFHCVPKLSALFLDYLYDFSKVQPLFAAPYSLENFHKGNVSLAVLDRPHRADLCQILKDQNHDFGAGSRTLENVEKLKDPDCCAVVTGQQAGLFTGPAYTIYKALTAVKLANHYACRGVKAVPVFWMATEDHDVAEVDHCSLLDTDSVVQTVRYEVPPEQQRRPAGKVPFSSSIEAVRARFLDLLPSSEFRAEMALRLESAYRPGEMFGRAFAQILSYLFSNYGLVLLDPLDPRLKQILVPLFQQTLQQAPRYSVVSASRNQQLLAAGYHLQVGVEEDSTPLLLEEEGGRTALLLENGTFRAKSSGRDYSLEDLQDLLARDPQLFSANVLLRPVAQDYLLPTLAYVAGPSEIAYLAQVSPLYDDLNVKMPIIFPRASISIVEKKIVKMLEKYKLDFCAVFRGSEAIMRSIVESTLDQTLSGRFAQIERDFETQLAELEPALKSVDPTLSEALRTAQRKIQYHVDHLRTKFIHAEAKHQEVITRQIEKTLAILHPARSLQEREINIFYFLSRYGMDLLAQLYEEIDLTDPDHRLVYVQ